MLITNAMGFFHHYQEHQGQHSILKQRGKGKLSDHIVQQHALSVSKQIIISKINIYSHTLVLQVKQESQTTKLADVTRNRQPGIRDT